MKTRKEQIIEIIRTELSKAFEMGLRQHPNDAENSEFYRPMIDLSITPRVADEIMALPLDEIERLSEENKKLRFMIDKGLGWEDMRNDIIMPHEL